MLEVAGAHGSAGILPSHPGNTLNSLSLSLSRSLSLSLSLSLSPEHGDRSKSLAAPGNA